MRPEQLEAWVLSIVDLVSRGQRIEDDRVELKSEWSDDAVKAARRVAGHANASGGDSVLWIIGLDEKRGLVPFAAADPAKWMQQLEGYFDGVGPSVQRLTVPTGGTMLYALLFDTTRRPFVVKNPGYGTQAGGPVSLEVPWREGTSVRSARREDLIRLLVPALQLPTFEVLSADASAARMEQSKHGYQEPTVAWAVSLDLYVSTVNTERVVLPVHRVTIEMETKGEPAFSMEVVQMSPPFHHVSTGSQIDSHTITASSSEAIISGPGRLIIRGIYNEPDFLLLSGPPYAELRVRFLAAGNDRQMQVSTHLLPLTPDRDANGTIKRWD